MKTLSSRMLSASGVFALALSAGMSHAQCSYSGVTLRAPTSTWTQQCDGRWSPAAVLDNNPGTGWAIGNCYAPGDRTLSEDLVFEAVPGPSLAAATRVRVRIHTGGFHSCCGGGHMSLGAFRLWITDDAQANFANSASVGGVIGSDWVPLLPDFLSAKPASPWGPVLAGPEPVLTLMGDGTILASGANPECAWYTLEATLPIADVTGVRVEVVDFNGSSMAAANGLPTGGPGRHSNGNMLIRQMLVDSSFGGPSITSQPEGIDVCIEAAGTLSVESDTPGATYQWRFEGVAIAGATAATLELSDLMEESQGNYDCVVSNACGSVTSEPAFVNVCRPDFNCDAFLDFFDYNDFVFAFETGQPRADYNGDGFIDFFDYDWYVRDFEEGC
jgi:hypothetical protein